VPEVHIRTLKRAAEIVGGIDTLAVRLNVTSNDIAAWISGEATPPADLFLKAAEIITEYDLEQLAQKRDSSSDHHT